MEQTHSEVTDMERIRWEVALEVGQAMAEVVDGDTSDERITRMLAALLSELAVWERRALAEERWLRERAEEALRRQAEAYL